MRMAGGARSRTTTHAERDGGELGALLRDWRRMRRLSQLDLALEAEVSQRHPSFMETGGAPPAGTRLASPWTRRVLGSATARR